MAPCWSQLPADLLLSIFSKLIVRDIVRSSAVCTTWLAVIEEFRNNPCLRYLRSPWVLFSKDNEGGACFYSFLENEFYTIRHPFIRSIHRAVGSSHGWLLAPDDRSELHMFNPITGACIDLPSILTFDYVKAIHDEEDGAIRYKIDIGNSTKVMAEKDFGIYYHRKAILSSNPLQEDYSVVTIHDFGFSIVRAGDKKWTTLAYPIAYWDAVFHKGELYMAKLDCQLEVWDASQPRPTKKKTISSLPELLDDNLWISYLVQTPRGDILHVRRKWKDIDKYYDPRFVDVFKVDIATGCQDQMQRDSLEEYALFLGDNFAFCLPSKEFFLQNTSRLLVYFTHDRSEWLIRNNRYSREVAANKWNDGVFDSVLPYIDVPVYMLPPIWITPTL